MKVLLVENHNDNIIKCCGRELIFVEWHWHMHYYATTPLILPQVSTCMILVMRWGKKEKNRTCFDLVSYSPFRNPHLSPNPLAPWCENVPSCYGFFKTAKPSPTVFWHLRTVCLLPLGRRGGRDCWPGLPPGAALPHHPCSADPLVLYYHYPTRQLLNVRLAHHCSLPSYRQE